MPTYEYRCTECGERTEAFQRMSDAALTTCPSCNKEALQRVVSGGAGVLYKGEGWYVTDYSKKSTGGKDSPPETTPTAPAKEGAPTKDAAPAKAGAPAKESGSTSTPASPSTGGSSSKSGSTPATKTGS